VLRHRDRSRDFNVWRSGWWYVLSERDVKENWVETGGWQRNHGNVGWVAIATSALVAMTTPPGRISPFGVLGPLSAALFSPRLSDFLPYSSPHHSFLRSSSPTVSFSWFRVGFVCLDFRMHFCISVGHSIGCGCVLALIELFKFSDRPFWFGLHFHSIVIPLLSNYNWSLWV